MKILAPNLGDRLMDKLDLCLLPITCTIRMTLLLVPMIAYFAIALPTNVIRALQNSFSWIAITCIHLILFTLSGLHAIVQIGILRFSLNVLQQSPMVRIALFWPRFYYSILKPKEKH